MELLAAYARQLEPWATRTARAMIGEVNERDREVWRSLGRSISRGMHEMLYRTPTGERMHDLLQMQVTLITSIPLEAGERVHKLAVASIETGRRASEIAADILRSGDVAESRATLIARTEVARTSTTLTQARCESIGVREYFWRTSEDASVRPGHKDMAGKVCEWANPPAVMENQQLMHFHPGTIWNCRCYGEPRIPGVD
jgi:SPP1 gp7 family putative phage head morphogenesis protein